MAGVPMQMDVSGWSSVETIATFTFGTLTGCINKDTGVGVIYWAGNSESPDGAAHNISLTGDKLKFNPKFAITQPMHNGSYISIWTNTISIKPTTATYGAASLMYPLA